MGGVFETTLSDAELAEQDRQAELRRATILAQNLSVTSEERRREQVEREELAGIVVDAQARDHLRAAHQARAAARDELACRREIAAAAAAHVARKRRGERRFEARKPHDEPADRNNASARSVTAKHSGSQRAAG